MENNTFHRAASAASSGDFRAVNPHCLGHIVDLADTHTIIAAEDIRDENGVKLWAKGLPVSRSLHEKMLRRSLARPLESSLSVEGGASMEHIVADALARIDENPVFSALAGSTAARGLLRDVQRLSLPGPVRLLLTSARQKAQAAYSGCLATMITCAGLASRLQLSSHDSSMLLIAAAVHDIGEMYVNPEYLDSDRRLAPNEWKYVASHPCVGHAFIREFTSFPALVSTCVLHHHERLDGSGYPFQLGRDGIERLGAILAVADCVSAIAMRGGCGLRERLEVALRIVPEEFDRSAASVVNAALRDLPEAACDDTRGNCLGGVAPALLQLGKARTIAEAMVCATQSATVRAATRYVLSVLASVDKSLRATGLFEPSQLAAIENDGQIMREVCLIVREVGWRLRNLARNVHLRVEASADPGEIEIVRPLIGVLDPASQPAA